VLAVIVADAVLSNVSVPFQLADDHRLYTIGANRFWEATIAAVGAVVATAGVYTLAGGRTSTPGDRRHRAAVLDRRRRRALHRNKRTSITALEEQAGRMARERELLTEGRDRRRSASGIAQELHDVIAHNLSLIVVQAQALGATAGDERVTHATEASPNLGRRTMGEMHRTLRLLRARDDAPELAPSPGWTTSTTCWRARARRPAGGPQRSRRAAPPRPERRPVGVPDRPGGADQRLQARRSRAHVGDDAYGRRALELTIVDRAAATSRPGPGGHGLIGMRERTALFGGTLTAGHGRRGVRGARVAALRRGRRMNAACRHRRRPADDARGFKAVLEATGDIEVVAEAGDGAEAVEAATRHMPDVVLMDIRMPKMDGSRRRAGCRAARPDPHDVRARRLHHRRAARGRQRLPAQGRADARVVEAVRAVAAGRRRALARRDPPAARPGRPAPPAAVSQEPAELAQLTDREREVLRMLAAGLTNAEIAAALVSRGDRQEPCLEPARQARAARPRAGRHLRLRDAPDSLPPTVSSHRPRARSAVVAAEPSTRHRRRACRCRRRRTAGRCRRRRRSCRCPAAVDDVVARARTDHVVAGRPDDPVGAGPCGDRAAAGRRNSSRDHRPQRGSMSRDADALRRPARLHDHRHARPRPDRRTPGDDVICAGAGDERRRRPRGNDTIYGDAGNDRLSGGDGNDTLYGDDGVDRLRGDDGENVLAGGES